MAIVIDKRAVYALHNFGLLTAAVQAGMTLRPEDYFVNYAEIDHEITSREDAAVQTASSQIRDRLQKWLEGIEHPDDVDPERLDLTSVIHDAVLVMVKGIWTYGHQTADQELSQMGVATNWEAFAAGVPAQGADVTDDDAFEWYDRYSKELAKSGQDALFIKMQPLILEALQKGIVRLALANMLLDDFTRFGSVRTDIIARTESTKAFNWGRRYRFDNSEALAGYRYSAIMDNRTTPICRSLHDHSWKKGDPDLDAYTPPNHYRCRSILVPISVYKDWTFQGPPAGWENTLTKSERAVLERFKNTEWYPTQANVKAKAAPPAPPAPASPKPKVKKPAAPRKKKEPAPAPAAPVDPNIPPVRAPGESAKDWTKRRDEHPATKLAAERADAVMSQSPEAAAKRLQEFVEYNVGNGVDPNHQDLVDAQKLADDLRAGSHDGKMVDVKWDPRTKKMVIREYQRDGHIFFQAEDGISDTDWIRLKDQVDQVAYDPIFGGVKIRLGDPSFKGQTGTIASYDSVADTITLGTQIRDNLRTVYHEVGHRVHQTKAVYSSPWVEKLQEQGISITDDKWKEWKKAADPFWENSRTAPGSDKLPADMVQRWNYPINAKYHYKKGTKENYYKEMFAESASVYLENDPAEIAKVQRTYPGLMEYMESIHKRGHIKIKE